MGSPNTGSNETRRDSGMGIVHFIIRFAVAALVLLVTSYFVPGFVIRGYLNAVIAALVIAAADYLIAKLFRLDASPFGKGLVGFVVAAVIIYLTQYFVPGMSVTILGAIIGALVIGLIDAIIPAKVF